MLLLCEPEVHRDVPSLLDTIVATAPFSRNASGWGGPTATLPTPEDPSPAPAGMGGDAQPQVPAAHDGVAGECQDQADLVTRLATLRLLLVDDHAAVRQAFAVALSGEAGLEVVGEAGNGPAALEHGRRLRPDVVLMGINLPGMSGIEATRLLRAEFPQTEVIGLSMYESEELGQAMRNAGARAYVSKSASYDTLLAAIRASRQPDPA
jgi:CheY-like chemotaxis protein